MQISHTMLNLENRIESQLAIADPEIVSVANQVLNALKPAIKQTLLEVTEMAAAEVNSQLVGQSVEVRMVGGDPELVVSSQPIPPPPPPPQPPGADAVEDEARITLRLPGYLKDLIADAADVAGDSVNSWLVDTLRTSTASRHSGHNVRETFEL